MKGDRQQKPFCKSLYPQKVRQASQKRISKNYLHGSLSPRAIFCPHRLSTRLQWHPGIWQRNYFYLYWKFLLEQSFQLHDPVWCIHQANISADARQRFFSQQQFHKITFSFPNRLPTLKAPFKNHTAGTHLVILCGDRRRRRWGLLLPLCVAVVCGRVCRGIPAIGSGCGGRGHGHRGRPGHGHRGCGRGVGCGDRVRRHRGLVHGVAGNRGRMGIGYTRGWLLAALAEDSK